MSRKRNGFFTFIFSLLPGAGEMYLGFLKQGASIMILFFGVCVVSSMFSNGALMLLLPVIWFYSFFHVHNINLLSDEEFYAIEDKFLFINNEDGNKIFSGDKSRKVFAAILIIIGLSSIWNMLVEYIRYLTDMFGWEITWLIKMFRNVPTLVLSIVLIVFGVYLIKGKKTEIDTYYIEGDEENGEASGK